MIRNISSRFSTCLRQALPSASSNRTFKAVADVEIDFSNRAVLKKYVGVDHLSKEQGTKAKFIVSLNSLLEAVKSVPETAEYRKAIEATCQYRLKVCGENNSDAAIEEVLDAHLEELIAESKEELRILPVLLESKPWDVPADYSAPVFDYVDASTILDKK
uniref:B13 n=1 Tax=Polytomella sp. Pringsheim 198.80 TaxID=37502 RepID=UPI001E1E2406|nr:Chain V, B13 [Polytomella sp. Pringsheim 198.80]7ARD_V Chain V, B13 [Polytomella sp. Pringsheim 198.80]